MKSFQIIRTHTSPYQKADFLAREKAMLETFPELSPVGLSEARKTPTILITNTHTSLSQLPPWLLDETRLIVHPNSGYDNFTTDHQLWKNTPVVIGHRIRAQAVAEYSLSALFQGAAELPRHLSWQKDRSWERSLLKDSPVWIFGYGHIGKIVAAALHGLGMKVVIVDPFARDCPYPCLKQWSDGDLSAARAIIACCSLNSSSRHLFNHDFFASLGEEVIFINGARGKLVEEESLRSYLLAHPRAFAFLDVFEEEPFNQDWHAFPQVWKTSHIAGVDQDLDQKIIAFSHDVLKDFLNLDSSAFARLHHKELLQNKWIEGELI
ncbi:MAG TPA: NAD(P)-dependent oxidoreductase [Bacteriovoracaceae bacterium]|nr:NAD(P)-dependent oxidoreductase [Bacteriovoracaceae bacterium]